MYVLSVHDLLQLDKFKHLTELQLISKQYDEEVIKEAFTVGMAIDEGYMYEYCQHRPQLSKQPVFGFVLRGEVRKDDAFRKSPFYTPEMQMLSTVRQDVSLTRELGTMSGMSYDYGKAMKEDAEKWDDEDSFEPDAEFMSQMIYEMNQGLLKIRGNYINDYGKYKTLEEWQNG